MRLEDRLGDTLQRHVALVEPGPDALGRATARLRASRRRRAVGGLVTLAVLIAVGVVVGDGLRTDRSDDRLLEPPDRASTDPQASTASRAVLTARYFQDRAIVLTDAGVAVSRGDRWIGLGDRVNRFGTVTVFGSRAFGATEISPGTVEVVRWELYCESCPTMRLRRSVLRTGATEGLQGLSMVFITPERGWLLAGLAQGPDESLAELYRTTDGGETWEPVSTPAMGHLTFMSDRVALLAGGPSGAHLYRSADAGETWTDVTPAVADGCSRNEAGLPLPQATGDGRAAFLQSVSCGGPGGRGLYDRAEVMVTEDGGATWSRRGTVTLPYPAFPGQLAVADPDTFIVANGSALLRSRDAGATFTVSVPDTGLRIAEIRFESPGFGWVIATRGDCASKTCSDPPRLYITRDEGRTLRAVDVRF